MLKVSHISVGYPQRTILSDLSFSARSGERIALLGLNGTGKSTLLLTLAGLLDSKSGSMYWHDQDLDLLTAVDRAAMIAVVTTDRFKGGNMTVYDIAAMGRYPFTGMFGKLSKADHALIAQALDVCGLQHLGKRLFDQLSDGQKQRVLIARALVQQTPIIVLDEPTSFLDIRGKAEVFELISQLPDKLILFSTHEVERALEVCSRCWIIDEERNFHDVTNRPPLGALQVKDLLGVKIK